MTFTMVCGFIGGALGVLIAVLVISNPATDVGQILASLIGVGGVFVGALIGDQIDYGR